MQVEISGMLRCTTCQHWTRPDGHHIFPRVTDVLITEVRLIQIKVLNIYMTLNV